MAESIVPFFDPFKIILVYFADVIGTDKCFQIKFIAELCVGLVMDLFVFVFVIVPQRRNITQYG